MINGIKIEQGYYDMLTGAVTRKDGHNIPMSVKLSEYLTEKYIKFVSKIIMITNWTEKDYKVFYEKAIIPFKISFTFGIDPNSHIEALSVCHPSDQFSRNDGLKRVINRIHQLRVNSENFDWKKYPWIYKLEQ